MRHPGQTQSPGREQQVRKGMRPRQLAALVANTERRAVEVEARTRRARERLVDLQVGGAGDRSELVEAERTLRTVVTEASALAEEIAQLQQDLVASVRTALERRERELTLSLAARVNPDVSQVAELRRLRSYDPDVLADALLTAARTRARTRGA